MGTRSRKKLIVADSAPITGPDREHQTYLRVAEAVLRHALSPLKVREIVERGIERGLFGDHPLSRTPEKSMQARLSTDILNKGGTSRFARTGRGRFTLRSKMPGSDAELEVNANLKSEKCNEPTIQEYIAERRVLRTPSEEVLCTSENDFREVLTFQGIDSDYQPILTPLLSDNKILYIPRSEAESRNNAKQFITYVLIQCSHHLLYFRRSYLSRAAEFLRGSKCIGFGGHVSLADNDILSGNDKGLMTCARRELAEELFLPNKNGQYVPDRTKQAGRATVQLFRDIPLECLGVLNDDSSEVGRRHVAVVYRAWLADWGIAQKLEKGDSSIKGLNWLDLTRDKVDISEFEYWSQLCLRKFYPSNVISRSSYKILRETKLLNHQAIVVCGRIGSGKSETANYLSNKLGLPLLNSGRVLQELMGTPPITEIGREEFQRRAQEFIRQGNGPDALAACIVEKASRAGSSRYIVDGIRHLATFERLSDRLNKELGLIYIQTPPDVAYSMYRAREVKDELTFTYRDFLKIYDAPVETDISSLGRLAAIYVFNDFGIDAFRRTLDEVAFRMGGQILDDA